MSKEAIWQSMEQWLESSDGKTETEKAQKRNVKLAELLRDTLLNSRNSRLGGLYETDTEGNWYLRKYLEFVLDADKGGACSVYGELLYEESGKTYNPAAYGQLTETEREKIARAAETYLTNAVEYESDKTREEKRIFSPIKEYETRMRELIIENETGNPLPYMEGGTDTAKIFWYKMAEQAERKKSNTTLPVKNSISWVAIAEFLRNDYSEYAENGHIPGRTTGSDELGLINGSIVTAGLDGSVKWNDTEKDSAEQLKAYEKSIAGNAGMEKEKQLSAQYEGRYLNRENFEKISAYVPDATQIRRGDILVYADTVRNRIKAGVISSIPAAGSAYGTNQKTFMEEMEIVYMDEEQGKALKRKVKESPFAAQAGKSVCVRLLKKERPGSKSYKTADWDVLDLAIAKAELTIGKMREQSQKNEEKWRFIPNTGEYLLLSDIKIRAETKKGLKVPTGETFKVKNLGAEDRNYEESKKDKGNIRNNKANRFEIALFDTVGMK
ncbi:hypothetical protein [Treponema brennaborense]|uniref:Uncharacterized protein n=1 Tax=Treponema brennaborense (strain DSM 12168 / CIP 105900 / DD5/3) TaxID=906968 RepID=F4LK84_TREBD|nr:hypothetical protein [Treponema brennaborense]AEE15473.1 hypothetical protein Trebr_0013 [Treponema brennaborense DSM 12168]